MPDYHQKPHPRRRIVHRRFVFQPDSDLGPVELFHVLYPSGEHELRTIPYGMEIVPVTSGRRKFHEMASVWIPLEGTFVGNACKLDLPEVFKMREINEVR